MRILIFFLPIFILAGCNVGTQIEDITLTLATGIDVKKKAVTLTSEILKTLQDGGQGNGGSSPEYYVESVTGKNLVDASTKQSLLHPKEIITLHNKVLVFGNEALKQGITEYVTGFMRTKSIQGSTYIITTKGKAKEILNTKAIDEQSIANSINELNNREGLETKAIQILEEASGKRQGVAVTEMNIIKIGGKERIIIGGAALLKKGKIVGRLNLKEMRLLSLLQNQETPILISVMFKNQPVDVILTKGKYKIKSNVSSDIPHFNMEGDLIFKVLKSKLGMINSSKDISELERLVRVELEKQQKDLFQKMMVQHHTDVIGFGDHLYRFHPSYWRSNHMKWNTIFPKVEVTFHNRVKIKNIGVQS